ncbi:hypothetical protein JNB63_04070 [Microbacterium trichothecenolyticum]|uniref:hypothetical protein n=1 Tax=Microbacterium trichothecenolyticum TaxID=69370 RepID=UPI001C6E86B8|nr:hypothetical protein [Microbacterium trichothecenolyticum]MBW9119262.1 hypothetical protein [Microbacterium trichothecenolyticum]
MRSTAPSAFATSGVLDDEPLALPAKWTPPPRPPLPVVAAIVPVVGAVALWLATGSLFSLWFALLGPLIAAATMLDARRAARRDGRRAAADAVRAREQVAAAVAARHEGERAQLWARHPDVARLITREGEIWRSGRDAALVIGEGERASVVRVTGGDGDTDASELRRRAARLTGAPVTLPLAAGVVVVGGETLATAVQRALVLQACLAFAPDELRILGPLGRGLDWMEACRTARGEADRRSRSSDPASWSPRMRIWSSRAAASANRCRRGARRCSRSRLRTSHDSSTPARSCPCASKRWRAGRRSR